MTPPGVVDQHVQPAGRGDATGGVRPVIFVRDVEHDGTIAAGKGEFTARRRERAFVSVCEPDIGPTFEETTRGSEADAHCRTGYQYGASDEAHPADVTANPASLRLMSTMLSKWGFVRERIASARARIAASNASVVVA